MPDRCQYELNIGNWEEEHDQLHELFGPVRVGLFGDDGCWRCPHDPVGSHDWCIFHLEPEARPTNASSAFVEVVEGDGPNRFIGATFPEFDLSERDLECDEWIDLRYVRIGNLDWNEATIDVTIDASGATFGDADVADTEVRFLNFKGAKFARLDLSRANFEEWTLFDIAEFSDRANFYKVQFNGDACFDAVRFGSNAYFEAANFSSETSFKNVRFRGEADFGAVEFGGRTYFNGSIFREEANFYMAKFGRKTDFQEIDFNAKTNFTFTNFNGEVNFARTEFGNGVGFWETKFRGDADFQSADFEREADFRLAEFDSKADFQMGNFNGEILFRGGSVGGTLHMPDTDLEQANFRDADLSGANFEDADLSRAALYGTDLTNAKLYGARLTDARISDATDFGVRDRGTLLPEFLPRVSPSPEVAYDPRSEPTPDDDGDVNNYTRAASVYADLESLAEDNVAGKLARKCFTWRKDMQRLRYYSEDGDGNDRDLLAGLRASLSNGLMRYGESPYRLLGWAGLLVFVCGLVYHARDLLVATGQNVGSSPTLLDALYFSTLTFTTLGMGDYRPANELGRALAIFETSAGVILLALLVFVFGRRATR